MPNLQQTGFWVGLESGSIVLGASSKPSEVGEGASLGGGIGIARSDVHGGGIGAIQAAKDFDVVFPYQGRAGLTELQIELGGYKDNVEPNRYDQTLLEARAASVNAQLTEHGVDGFRRSSNGYGMANPVASHSTDDGRELDRQVELKVN